MQPTLSPFTLPPRRGLLWRKWRSDLTIQSSRFGFRHFHIGMMLTSPLTQNDDTFDAVIAVEFGVNTLHISMLYFLFGPEFATIHSSVIEDATTVHRGNLWALVLSSIRASHTGNSHRCQITHEFSQYIAAVLVQRFIRSVARRNQTAIVRMIRDLRCAARFGPLAPSLQCLPRDVVKCVGIMLGSESVVGPRQAGLRPSRYMRPKPQ